MSSLYSLFSSIYARSRGAEAGGSATSLPASPDSLPRPYRRRGKERRMAAGREQSRGAERPAGGQSGDGPRAEWGERIRRTSSRSSTSSRRERNGRAKRERSRGSGRSGAGHRPVGGEEPPAARHCSAPQLRSWPSAAPPTTCRAPLLSPAGNGGKAGGGGESREACEEMVAPSSYREKRDMTRRKDAEQSQPPAARGVASARERAAARTPLFTLRGRAHREANLLRTASSCGWSAERRAPLTPNSQGFTHGAI
uniref:Uncharacterized protein n=1 Tax=Oryza sativa subsp. japonica TaxID=39947 RepID=Q6Z8A5_ORYSJ|nr:hypothetical protein [Oryza sativa Japonica Group]BAD07894.1 hypothetical protein [Oryza sativa Japonica Group]